MKRSIFISIILIGFASCNFYEKENQSTNIISRNFDDSFNDSLMPFWYTHQAAHPDRFQIVKDSNDANNDLLKVYLTKLDTVAKGLRSEIIIKPKDSFGYLNKHSFRFKFPKSFFEKEERYSVKSMA